MPKKIVERRRNRSGQAPKQMGYTKKQLIEVELYVEKHHVPTAVGARHLARKYGYNIRQTDNFIRAAQRAMKKTKAERQKLAVSIDNGLIDIHCMRIRLPKGKYPQLDAREDESD